MNEPLRFDPTQPRRKASPLAFTVYSDGGYQVRKDWLMKGVLAHYETSSWVGPPGAGKSALITDLAWHCAADRNWRGFRAQGPMAVVYVALERGDLLHRRFEAYRRQSGVKDLPIAVVTDYLDLMQPACVGVLVATIQAVRDRFKSFKTEGVLLIVDTFAKAIAMGGGDENSARDQNRVLGHLRQVQAATTAHVALIGHTGKDEARGARGSNAHLGDVDLMVQITTGRVKEAKVIKANDQAEGRMTTFELETYDFGPDEEGDPCTTSLVAQSAPGIAPETARATLSPKHAVALEALDATIGNFGRDVSGAYGLPGRNLAVSADQWRDELVARGVLKKEAKFLRQDFHKLHMAMQSRHIIGHREDMFWRIYAGASVAM